MTNEEKFSKGVVVYKKDDDYICECWGASTKHPDTFDRMSAWMDMVDTSIIPKQQQVFQWLLYLASRRMFPFHAKQLAEYALENWYLWEKEE